MNLCDMTIIHYVSVLISDLVNEKESKQAE